MHCWIYASLFPFRLAVQRGGDSRWPAELLTPISIKKARRPCQVEKNLEVINRGGFPRLPQQRARLARCSLGGRKRTCMKKE